MGIARYTFYLLGKQFDTALKVLSSVEEFHAEASEINCLHFLELAHLYW